MEDKQKETIIFQIQQHKRSVCLYKQKGCPFRVWASSVSNIDPTIKIKSLNLKHTCDKVFNNFHMTLQCIARKYSNIFRDDANRDIKGLLVVVQNNLGYIIHRMKAFRSKELALK